jgi:alanine racemase
MDLTTLDVTALGDGGCRVGDEAELFGNHVSIESVAAHAGTVAYEVLTQLSPRMQRRYLEKI